MVRRIIGWSLMLAADKWNIFGYHAAVFGFGARLYFGSLTASEKESLE